MMNTKEIVRRKAPIEMSPDEFRGLGHRLVDQVADVLDSLKEGKRPVTPNELPKEVRRLLSSIQSTLPQHGTPSKELIEETTNMLFEHSLFNGHPRFWGYITSSPAPIGALGDFLASSVNPNVGAWGLSPIATEIELQTVRWIAEMIGYPTDSAGLLVSGGNMANFVCFLAARRAKATWDVRTLGISGGHGMTTSRLCLYASKETHTWIQKAADLFGVGTDSIHWVPTDDDLRMDTPSLEKRVRADVKGGYLPFLVVGTAGSVATGIIDPLYEISAICRQYNLWFHVDGAYGGFAAVLPEAPKDLGAIRNADSVAVDPHKWLYAPLESGCALVRNPRNLVETFSYHPAYYHFDPQTESESAVNFVDYGPQNSRGFRALKVWLALRQVGKEGYVQMISDDIALARELFVLVGRHPSLEPFTQSLSITTFRFVPKDLREREDEEKTKEYLNKLNEELLSRLQRSGEVFLSNAVVNGKFLLRACIVNFRTSLQDIESVLELVSSMGTKVDDEIRPFGTKEEVSHEEIIDNKVDRIRSGWRACNNCIFGSYSDKIANGQLPKFI
jgi:glutamate/tyrosine decarboxylase-like PLP-dependent enzyme